MVGKSTSGNWLMPIRVPATTPKTIVRGHQHPGQDRLADADFGDVHGGSFLASGPLSARRAASSLAPASRPPVFRPAGSAAGRHPPGGTTRTGKPFCRGLGAADDQALAGRQAGKDFDLAVGGPHADGQDALDGQVVLDDEGDEAALARPDGRLGDDRGARAGC